MKVTVARTLDDFMKVMVIRGIIFIGEHGHRYNMEFDEHELSNRTHMLALDDTNEPIGIMRVLKDGKDAKFERLAVMPEYRKKGVAVNIVKAGIEYCKTQGIENIFSGRIIGRKLLFRLFVLRTENLRHLYLCGT